MNYQERSKSIVEFYDEASRAFGDFQQKSKLPCPSGCGQCCLNPEISCAPFELLPLALHLLDLGMAEKMLEAARLKSSERCLLLDVNIEGSGRNQCSHYQFRPFICRAFGVSARQGKNGRIDYSICKVLKESDQSFIGGDLPSEEIPLIENWKKKLEVLDPHLLDREVPVNQALVLILEKILIWDSYQKENIHFSH